MSKIKIRLAFLGHPLFFIDTSRIQKWKSEYWELVSFDNYSITADADLPGWSYSNKCIKTMISGNNRAENNRAENILLVITSVEIEDNYIAHAFDQNKICLTYYGLLETLNKNNIPHENLLIKLIYSAVISYKFFDGQLLPGFDSTELFHGETRRCLFDMCGNRDEVIYSLHEPCICTSCYETLTNRGCRIGKNEIKAINKEIKKIKKRAFYVIADWIKQHPVLTICLSSLLAFILGLLGSLSASLIWKFLLKMGC